MVEVRKKRKRAESRPASSQMAAAMGRAIQVVRTDRGWSRKDFAERTALSYSFLSEIENGVKEPSSRTFALIADALDVAPGALLYDAERRLAEVGSESGDETLAFPGQESRTGTAAGEPVRSTGRTRSVEQLKQEASYFAGELPSSDTARADAPIHELAPRIERSRRVLDWLAGPLARRSSEDSTATAAPLPRPGVAGPGYRTALMDLEAPPTELESVEPGSTTESVERILGALLPLLGGLSPEDRELVLNLARRLAQRESES